MLRIYPLSWACLMRRCCAATRFVGGGGDIRESMVRVDHLDLLDDLLHSALDNNIGTTVSEGTGVRYRDVYCGISVGLGGWRIAGRTRSSLGRVSKPRNRIVESKG